jgi:putative transposase
MHLLLYNNKEKNVIPDAIRLMAGRTGQEYNNRKKRKGAFWDRYHATAVESNHHLIKCITYIDMNMVRAGAVEHPSEWEFCGYNEIQNPRKRKGIIDFDRLMSLLKFNTYDDLKEAHGRWIEEAIQEDHPVKETKWTQSIAVGGKLFIEQIRAALGFKARGRKLIGSDETFQLRENQTSYGRFNDLGADNVFLWDN